MKNITISDKHLDAIAEQIGDKFLIAAQGAGMDWDEETVAELGYTLMFCDVDHTRYPLEAAIAERGMFVHQIRVNGVPAAHAVSFLDLDVVAPALQLQAIGFGETASILEKGLDWFASNAPVLSPLALLRAPGRGVYAIYKFDKDAPLVLPVLTPPGFGVKAMIPCSTDAFITALNSLPSSTTSSLGGK